MEHNSTTIRLTQYSHGAGCGCKISPAVLQEIVGTSQLFDQQNLLVGNESSDDAAVVQINEHQAIVSTTDFFMPIVDDPFQFGRIAAANALSDVFAMGARPITAIAILGWPIDKLAADVAQQVVEGGRSMCAEAGIALAGGHSIDCPEPIFGLAVTGVIDVDQVKRNSTAKPHDVLLLTKPLGIGVYTTAEKKGLLKLQHTGVAATWMTRLNHIGANLAKLDGVHAMTDVTGFGLLGHLLELCRGSEVHASVEAAAVPMLEHVEEYIEAGAVPGGTLRNWQSYGAEVDMGSHSERTRHILTDPQTSGGLLISCAPSALEHVQECCQENGHECYQIGTIVAESTTKRVTVA